MFNAMDYPIPAFLEQSPIYQAVTQGKIDDIRLSTILS
jgi:hypothetical protein